eukprot:g3664.t1
MTALWLWLCVLSLGHGGAHGFAAPSMALKLPVKYPVVVLPGFGNAARDYTDPLNGGAEKAMVASLNRRGLDTFVVPLERTEWFKVAGAVFTLDFWKGTCKPDGPAYGWYLQKVKDTVRESLEETGASKVLLVAHSAGGWLARAALGEGEWEEGVASQDVVAGLVTLGSPHFAGPMDMTRGALAFTSNEYPGAFLKDKGISYVTVAGAALMGDKDAPRRSRARFAYGSYETVCGEGNIMGDACVPLAFAHLEGAEQVTLEGVFHSVDKPDEWYGSEGVVDRWLVAVAQELGGPSGTGGGGAPFLELFASPFEKMFSR